MKKRLKNVKHAMQNMKLLTTQEKKSIILQMAQALKDNKQSIIKQNQLDIKFAKNSNLNDSLIDRLLLNETRIDDMANSLENIAMQDDPVGKILHSWELQKGLFGQKVTVPIGIIAIIYESRPNVTSDTIGLCFKSSNACVLKGGKEAQNSNQIICKILQDVLKNNNISKHFITYIKGSRQKVQQLIKMDKYIDLIIPRGGEGLVKFVSENSTISVIKHDKGLCHLYVDKNANFDHALNIAINAKCQRSGVCNAIETLLVHQKIADKILPLLYEKFKAQNTILKGCKSTQKIIKVQKATKIDWKSEYLQNIISIKVVKNTKEAIKHITKYGSMHSEAIVSENKKSIKKFFEFIDASCVYANASTRFTDGAMFGLGGEIGISTNKLHVRGPVGANDLVTYKYQIIGHGHVR